MRIAILGGGGSGLTTAWLLQHQHHVEVFERAPILGGHVRTLNKNVKCNNLPEHVSVENGVLGFHNASYPDFLKLMKRLQVPLLDDRPDARLYTGQSVYPTKALPFLKSIKPSNIGRKVHDVITMFRMGRAFKKFNAGLDALDVDTPPTANTGPLLSTENRFRELQAAILMLSFSTPYSDVGALPAGLTLPFMRALRQRDWSYVEGGVYRYMQILLQDFNGKVHTNARVTSVLRNPAGVELIFQNGDRNAFDKVVFAVSPGQILGLLGKPSDAEVSCFSPWKDRPFLTIAHTDRIYQGYDKVPGTPMDFFIDEKKNIIGYNTSMNTAYRLSDKTPYAFSYNLEKMIRPEAILDKQEHVVPVYTGEAFGTRPEIKERNGENHCYYAGAWLGNGLHEGAVSSAIEVAGKLGVQW